MSVMQEYLKKYGNSTVSTPRMTAPVSSAGAGNGTMSEYLKWLEEEEERKRLQQAMNRNTLGLGNDNDEDEDIAPVDDSLLDFFQKGSFSDGFDWHDIPTAILGTAGDAALNVAKGALGIVEGVADLGVYGVAGVADALGHDEYAEGARRRASENLIDKVTGGAEDYLNKYSVLGRTSDAILQGVGQVGSIMATGGLGAGAGLGRAGVTALTTGLMGVSGVGSGMGEAYQSGATDEEALKYGLISGAADAISEMLFSGLGKGVNAIGFNQGLLGVDDLLAKKVSGMFSGQIAKNFAEFGIKASAEGLEEVIAGVAQAWGKWKTYESDEKFLDIVKDENLLEQFITGMVTSGIAQSGIVPGMKQGSLIESNQTGRDLVTGYTQNEQSVIDKAVENRIKAREENGQTVTHKDRTDIETEVKRLLDRGYLDADEIESILGGEEYTSVKNELSNFFASDDYKAYKQAEKAEADARAEFDPLVKMKQGEMTGEQIYRRDELKKILDESKVGELKSKVAPEATRIAQLRNKMRGNVQSMVQGTRMAESYNELARKQQKFQVDVSQYTDENAKKTVQSILDSGLGDNSNQFHETVDFLAKLSADKGVVFDLTNNEKLKGTEHYKEGYWTHGFVSDDGNIVLNYDSPRALNTTVGHEITHVLEKAGVYKELSSAVRNYAISKEGLEKYNARIKEAEEIYRGKKNTTAEGEVTADIIGEYLFTDYEFISNLSTSNRNVFQKIYDEIKYMVKIATAGSNEARELLKAKKMFDKAYRENVKGKPETAVTEETEVTEADNATAEEREFSDADVKYSIRKKDPPKNVIEGFKVFVVKDGKLFPPMVANPEGEGTPVGVWLDADVGGLSYDKDGNVKLNNRGRFKVKAGGKGTQGSGGDLAFRPGWHLGEYPDASQFGRENEEHLVPNKKGEMVPSKELFPYNFVWARCEVAADANYQLDAMSFGVNENGKFERSQAGLPYIPEDGYYKYRTNADPNTAPWIISGSIKVVEILNDDQVAAECAKHGVTPQQRQGFTYGAKSLQPEKRPGGKIDLSMFGLTEGMVTPTSEDALNQIRATEDMADTRKAETLELLKTLPGYAKRQIDFDDENIIKEFGMNNQDVNEYRQMAEESGHSYLNDDKIYSGSELITEEQNEQGLDRVSETQYSLSKDTEFSQNAIKKNQEKLLVDAEAMTAAKELRERIASRMTEIKDRGLVALPEDMEGNTYIANSSYDGTEENTTICPRSLASEAFVDAVSEYLGRPLTVEEQIYISQDLQGRSLTPECTYCYVATDRKAYRAFLGEYINQRDAVIEKIKANPNADVSKSGDLYREFLNGRKDTKPMYNRFKMWVDAYQNGTPMVEASHLANISKLMGDIKEFGEDLKPQIVDAMKYAQSASWAKKRVSYVAYNGHILKWKDDRIKKLNSHYGLRMYSFSDFHPAFVLENMQMITDASVRGLKMLGYTKDTDFVEIFAPSGMNINISTFGFETDGNVYENNIIGAEWAKAQELRSQYPNVGITFVATNDTLVEWALDQDWIDVVIPYHLVRTGAEVAKAFGYTNYTSESSDTKTSEWKKGDKKSIAPTEHNNDFQTYMDALAKNHLNPRFERFKDNPNYMKLVNECRQSASQSKPVQPVFNEDAAMVALAKLEANGYYQPIGGSVDRMYEIASEVAEDMTKNIAPTKYSMSKDSDGNSLTAEQEEFFKDSKVRDANGGLLKVYHGTTNNFTTFRQNRADGWGTGIYFTDNREEAYTYGENVVEAYLNIQNPYDADTMSYYDIGAENTKAYRDYDMEVWKKAYDEYDTYEEYKADGQGVDMYDIYTEEVEVFNKILRELGYDGIIATGSNNIDGLEIVAFKENQPKLTTNTNPTSDSDIRYSMTKATDFPIDAEDIARQYFGTTEKWSETGWLLRDGTQLDFSGRHWERDPENEIDLGESYYSGKRNMEHYEIAEAFPELREYSRMEYRGEHLDRFQNRGNIRIVGKGIVGIEKMPTEEQFEKLRSYFGENIDRTIVVGIGRDGLTYKEGTKPSVIIEGIRDYFSRNRKNQSELMRFHTQYSLSKSTDNEGNQLTREQDEFFKDSKIRDNEGNLRRVYHTTKNDFTVFDKSRKGEATDGPNTFLGFFFAESPDHMEQFPEFQNGKTDAYYLDMKKPMDLTNLSRESFMDIVELTGGDRMEAAEVYDEELEAEKSRARLRGDNNTSLSISQLLYNMVGDYYHADFFDALKPNYDKLVAKGYDGVIDYLDEMMGEREFVVFDSNQAKLTTNTKPTKDPDIRYSMTKATDTDYMDAVNRGDTKAMQKMVDEEAMKLPNIYTRNKKVKGETVRVPQVLWHYSREVSENGKTAFTEFNVPAYFSKNQDYASYMFRDGFRPSYEKGQKAKPFYITATRQFNMPNVYGRRSFSGQYYMDRHEFLRGLLDENKMYHINSFVEDENIVQAFRDAGYDLIYDKQSGYDTYIVLNANQIKSADPVTYDENGDVIPLSERFNPDKTDIRYSVSKEGAEQSIHGDYHVYGSDFGLDDPLADFAPVAETVSNTERVAKIGQQMTDAEEEEWQRERLASLTDKDAPPRNEPIRTVRERLTAKVENFQKELENNRKLREQSGKDFDTEIARLQEEYNGKKKKNTKAANDILRRIERIQRMKGNVDADYAKRISDLEARVSKAREELRTGQSTTEQGAMRRDIHASILNKIKNKFAQSGFDFDNVLKKAKNLSTWATVDNTPQRVMEKSLGYKEGQILSDMTVDQVARNETEGIKWLNSFTDRKNGLLAQISKQYRIKPGSKESSAAQMYAEGFYVNENEEIIQYGDNELAKDFPDAQVQKNIKGLARDPRIRRIYDETLAMINASRARNAYPEIQKLDNYFLHFRAMDDTFSRLGLPFNPNDIKAKDLPTDLNGVTADLKPGQPYFASAMHRTGKRTSFDLLGGLERYLSSAKNQIYHIDDIQTLRALRNYIAETYGQAHGLESLDLLTEEEAQERIKQVYGSHLSTFAKFLNEEANIIAGKTALIDRGLEGIIGRRGITFLNTVNRQVGSNMVGYNISSSLTNFLPVAQTLAKTNKFDFLKAFAQTVSNKVGSVYGRNDGFAENSPVIIRRKGEERFHRTLWQKLGDPGYALMGAVDDISTELIARTKYNELTRKGMDSAQAHIETDKWVSRLMGDRSIGQQPQLYNSKMLGLLTKFQLEVRNQLDSQFYDTIQEAKLSTEEIQDRNLRNGKTAAKVASTFFQLAVVQHLFGKAFESVAGYNPAFDIVEVLIQAFGWDDDEESEDTALDNIEQAFFTLLEDLPYTSTLTGGRIPISSALPIQQLIKGEDQYGNEKSRWETLAETAPYYLLPAGYGQIKKTSQGLDMFSDEHPIAGSYTDSGKLRFPVEETPLNIAQAAIFGQYASANARDYFDNERQALSESQIQEFIDVDISIQEYWEYRDGLKGLDSVEEKFEYINDLDLPVSKKNILINNVVDRKDPVDMTDYDQYASYDEFDYATKNPEKYDFLLANDISYEQYRAYDEDTKSNIDNIYTWYRTYPDKVVVASAVTDSVVEYRSYTSALNAIRADQDQYGNTINGSAKEKKIAYINSLNIDYGAKLILFKSEYEADDTYNQEIIDYLNGRDDISAEEMVTILKELGFVVDSEGNIYW